MSASADRARTALREQAQLAESTRTLAVYGDVLALLDLVPEATELEGFDAASFILGCCCVCVALVRDGAALPSVAIERLERGQR